ncbi:MAG: hypothetical protein C5B49_00990 [Bdellovibrio sp.]|nr:MAG: hypothetical protein C5B49_00990 [Bdellovibrio sp.]
MPRRVLLFIDDFNENLRVETLLKKVGFDVIGLVTEARLEDQVISFGPEAIVASGKGEKLSAMSVASRLKDQRSFSGAVILGFPPEVRVSPSELLRARVDRILDSPFRSEALLTNLAQVLRMDPGPLIEKYKKISAVEDFNPEPDGYQIVRGSPSESRVAKIKGDSREERYRQVVKQNGFDKAQTTFEKSSIRQRWNDLEKDWNVPYLAELRRLKVEFAKALFGLRKKKD